MFIISRKNYKVKRSDGSSYVILSDYIGEIPSDVAESDLVQRAIRGGGICVPEGTKDKQMEAADSVAKKKAVKNDIRPDAQNNK